MLSPLTFTLLITALAAVLLISNAVRPDIVGLLVALALGFSGVLTVQQALAGFSSPVVFVLVAIFVLTRGLETTGVSALLGRRLARLGRGSEGRLVAVTMLAAALLSLFMNTVAAAAVLLSPVLSITRQRDDVAPSRVLIPLAYGTLLGGTATLLTTANLVTSAALATHGLRPYGLLDFLPVGLPVTFAGLIYMVLIGRHLLPRRSSKRSSGSAFADLVATYHLEKELHALEVLPLSPLVGRPAHKPGVATDLGLTPVGMLSTSDEILLAHRLPPDHILHPGDVVVASGSASAEALQTLGLKPHPAANLCETFREQATLVELALNPRGAALGQTPQALQLYARYGLRVLAVWRNGKVLDQRLYALDLQPGDALLVLLPPSGLEHLRESSDFLIVNVFGSQQHHLTWRSAAAVALLLLALGPAALGWAPLALTALGGAVGMMLLRILPPEQAYRAIPWRVIFLIGGMIPLGTAMRQTGAAVFLSRLMLAPLHTAPPWAIAAAFLLLTALLAQVTSGQVAPLLLAPLAIATAEAYGLPPRGLGMAVAIGASFAFLLPTGHPVNLLVMGPGDYQPGDYFKVGLPLLLVVTPVAVAALQLFWLR